HRRIVEIELGHRPIVRRHPAPAEAVQQAHRPAAVAATNARYNRTPMHGLNPPQAAAVLHIEGPLLVLAGAGSGKTRVIVEKIAHLIGCGRYPAKRIAAITFTNKSAKEMRERVAKRLREQDADEVT